MDLVESQVQKIIAHVCFQLTKILDDETTVDGFKDKLSNFILTFKQQFHVQPENDAQTEPSPTITGRVIIESSITVSTDVRENGIGDKKIDKVVNSTDKDADKVDEAANIVDEAADDNVDEAGDDNIDEATEIEDHSDGAASSSDDEDDDSDQYDDDDDNAADSEDYDDEQDSKMEMQTDVNEVVNEIEISQCNDTDYESDIVQEEGIQVTARKSTKKRKLAPKCKTKDSRMNKDTPTKLQRLTYDRSNLQRAYEATVRGMSVYKAARQFRVPESTLRDRTRGNVNVNAKPGQENLLSLIEEEELVDFIVDMASIGYAYNKVQIQNIGHNFALSVGKHVKSKKTLSNSWFYEFLGRWPSLKKVLPHKVPPSKARSSSKDQLDAYYKELGSLLSKYKLHKHPEHIYFLDIVVAGTELSPSKTTGSKELFDLSLSSPNSSNINIIACGNAVGYTVPPYYIFPGKRWNSDLLNGAVDGSSGEMINSRCSHSYAFATYLANHFVKHVPLCERKKGTKTLILYDGNKAHIGLTLKEWAKRNNVIFFVLPPYSSESSQAFETDVFLPFKNMFNDECYTYSRQNPGISITRLNIAKLTSEPYIRAFGQENLTSAFGKAGIHPFNPLLL